MTTTVSTQIMAALSVAAVFFILLPCAGLVFLAEGFFLLAGGWLTFLYRVAPQVRISGEGLAVFAGSLALLVWGGHWLLLSLAEAARSKEASSGTPHDPAYYPPLPRKAAWPLPRTLALSALLLVSFVAGISVTGIAHQLVWLSQAQILRDAREAADGMQDGNNVKQLVLSVQNYSDTFGNQLPPGATADAEGRLLHSWVTLLLPYMEQKPLFDQLQLNEPWDSPANQAVVRDRRIQCLIGPYERHGNLSLAGLAGHPMHYAGNVRVLGGLQPLGMHEIEDGTANTLLVGGVSANPSPWAKPKNWRDPALGLHHPGGFGSRHPSGWVNFGFVDGRVQALRPDVDPEVLHALSTPHGGEQIFDDRYR